jgi:DNA-nicking Smr family endonuclease
MAKLSDLKKLVADARAAAPAPVPALATSAQRPAPAAKRAVAASKHGDADVDLARAFADVAPLPASRRARLRPPAPAPIPRQRIADDRDALEASKYGDGGEPVPDAWEAGQEQEAGQTYVRRGIGSDVLAKLRRGHWSIQAELDLHGYTSDSAHDVLADFLDESLQHGFRCVRVIHGKGLTSPNREPVLKGRVRRWLSHWDDVLAYAEAPPSAGGGGAVMILLRGK